MDTACQTRTCSAGMCGFSYQPSGTPTTDTTAGDCAKPVCDGAGNVTMVADATDPPTTTNQCQIGMCSGTTGSIGNKADGTACTQSGGNVCLSGSCVGCIASTDCPSLNCNASSCGPYVLISEVRTRGANGAADEFIELYNPLSTPVTLGADISILGRSSTATGYTTRWTGAGQVIPSHYHFLIGGTAYAGPPAADAALVNGLPDQMSLVLVQNVGGTNQVIDAFCFYCGTNPFDATFTCNGTPFNKPGCSSTTNYDAAERKPGGSLGNGTNTRNNSADFLITSPSNQRDLASAPLP